jgi:hypothetical protein
MFTFVKVTVFALAKVFLEGLWLEKLIYLMDHETGSFSWKPDFFVIT